MIPNEQDQEFPDHYIDDLIDLLFRDYTGELVSGGSGSVENNSEYWINSVRDKLEMDAVAISPRQDDKRNIDVISLSYGGDDAIPSKHSWVILVGQDEEDYSSTDTVPWNDYFSDLSCSPHVLTASQRTRILDRIQDWGLIGRL